MCFAHTEGQGRGEGGTEGTHGTRCNTVHSLPSCRPLLSLSLTHTHTHASINIHVRTGMQAHVISFHACAHGMQKAHRYVHAYTCAQAYVRTFMCSHTSAYARAHAFILACMHTDASWAEETHAVGGCEWRHVWSEMRRVTRDSVRSEGRQARSSRRSVAERGDAGEEREETREASDRRKETQ